MTTTPTPIDIAPYLGRLVLSASDSDDIAFQQAVEDAHLAGVTPIQLLIVVSQSLGVQLDTISPEWRTEVRRGLLEVAEDNS